jgi:antagonist of KipI
MASIIIQSAGLLTTVQDRGRYGYQRYGMPVAGAMDNFSLELANLLAGNSPGTACLEATITGPEIFFTDDTVIAVTGADMQPAVNGKSIPVNSAVPVRQGDRLDFTQLKNGCRTYIAFAGGIDVAPVMGSRSTYLRARVGGHQGRAVRKGDELPLGETRGEIRTKKIPEGVIPHYLPAQTVRVIPGPEIKMFEMAGLQSFLTAEYIVTAQSDRMGYRLSGEVIRHTEGRTGIISAGIAQGTIQVPGDGQPIILMADRQTTGGYTRIACVITVDLTLVAQLKPGDTIRFSETTLDKAQEMIRERQRMMRDLLWRQLSVDS